MNIAILLGGGQGVRFGSDKIQKYLGDFSVAEHSIKTFSECKKIDGIVVVASEKNEEFLQEVAKKYSKVLSVCRGGETRFKSSVKGFEQVEKNNVEIVVFHNLANPFVLEDEIISVIDAAKNYGAAGVAHPVTSTLRSETGTVLPRETIYAMETPQALQYEVFTKGVFRVSATDVTDDLCVAEAAGVKPKILPAHPQNKKITFAGDLSFFQQKNTFSLPKNAGNIAVGLGQDSHIFSNSGTLILGGIEIPDAPKLLADSDGDAVLHALTNAVSSVCGTGSLSLFADEMCKNGIRNSIQYSEVILQRLREQDGKILHLSLSLEAKKPKLEMHFERMKERLSDVFSVPKNAIGITATTGEGMSDFGRGEGISVWASVTVAFNSK